MTALLDQPVAATPARKILLEGARDITPMVIGVVPFGLAIGATIGTSTVSTGQGLASAPVILAGAAQLTTIKMLDSGAAPLIVVLSALMINARILLYSASIAPWFRDERLMARLALALPVIDQLHFTVVPRFERGDLDARGRRLYYAGAATWLVSAWLTVQTLAVAAGARLPEWTGLHLAAPLALAGLLARSMSGRTATTAAITAGAIAIIGAGLPFHSAVLVAACIGIGLPSVAVSRARHPEVVS